MSQDLADYQLKSVQAMALCWWFEILSQGGDYDVTPMVQHYIK